MHDKYTWLLLAAPLVWHGHDMFTQAISCSIVITIVSKGKHLQMTRVEKHFQRICIILVCTQTKFGCVLITIPCFERKVYRADVDLSEDFWSIFVRLNIKYLKAQWRNNWVPHIHPIDNTAAIYNMSQRLWPWFLNLPHRSTRILVKRILSKSALEKRYPRVSWNPLNLCRYKSTTDFFQPDSSWHSTITNILFTACKTTVFPQLIC